MQVNWVAVGSVATVVAALATAILAGATYWLVRTTREELKQTKREITATEKQAEASTKMLAEVQIDRDLNWRPYLVVDKTGYGPDLPDGVDTVFLKNIGRGPAFNCVCARIFYIRGPLDVPQWRLATAVGTIEAGGIKEFSLTKPGGAGSVPLMYFESPVPGQPNLAIFYQDSVGQRAYRQTPPRAAPDVWAPDKSVDPWVSWYFNHIHVPVPKSSASS
jgi:hypothetical protein